MGIRPDPTPEPEYRSDPAWNKLLLILSAAVVALALLVVPGLLNRGGQNPVAAAAEATSNVPGVRITFTGRSDGPVAMTIGGRRLPALG